MQAQIRDVVLRSPVTVSAHDSIQLAERQLIAAQASDVYVIDECERLLGVVPDYEFLKHRLREGDGRESITTLMTPASVSLSTDTSLYSAALLLREGIRGSIPIVEHGRLVGQLCRMNLLRILAEESRARQAGDDVCDHPYVAECPACVVPPPHFLGLGQAAQDVSIACGQSS